MKTPLTPLYRLLAGLAALCLVAVLAVQLIAIFGRFVGVGIDGHDAYAGYFLAAAAFLALAYTLRQGDHIRVTLLISRLTHSKRLWVEVLDLLIATAICSYFAWFSIRLAWGSWRFDDISQNIDATPLWIPQISMAVGVTALALAYFEELLYVLWRRHLPPQQNEELARTE